MGYTSRVTSHQWTVFDTVNAVQRADWDALLDAGTDPSVRRFQSADTILDLLGLTELELANRTPPLIWQPRSPCAVRAMTASGAITKRRFVQLVAPELVAAATVSGAPYQGIAMNDAANGERVYVMLLGTYAVQTGATPALIGDPVSSDAIGRTTTAISQNWFSGIVVSGTFSLGGVNHQLVSLSGLQRQAPSLVELMLDPRLVTESDLGVTAPGNFVSDWDDQSPHNNDPAQPAGPSQWAYINDGSGPNGMPYMQGNAAQSRFMRIVPPVPATLQPANLTMFIVARWRTVTAFAAMFNATNTAAWQDGYGFGKTSPGVGVPGQTIASWVNRFNGAGMVVQSPILNLNQWYVFEMWYTGATLNQMVNGVLSASSAFAGPIVYNPAAQVGLGAAKLGAGTFAFYFDGDFTSFAIDGTAGALNATQRSVIRQYLGNKYGIVVTP